MSRITKNPHDISYYQHYAQKRYPHAIECLHKSLKFLTEIMLDNTILENGLPKYSIGTRIDAAKAMKGAAEGIIRASGVYQPPPEDISSTVLSVPLFQILLAPSTPQKVIELIPQTNGIHK